MTTTTDLPAPTNVHEALVRIIGDLPAIGKDQHASEKQGGYAYRGIEAITRELQPLLVKYGVVIVPRTRLLEHIEARGMNASWTTTTIEVEWTVTHAASQTSITAATLGMGMDGADKGANKAQTQALKYLLLQMFCIADTNDDTDGHDYANARQGQRRGAQRAPGPTVKSNRGENTRRSPDAHQAPPAEHQEPTYRTPQEADVIRAGLALPDDERAAFRAALRERFGSALVDVPPERHQEVAEWASDWIAGNR